MHTPQEPIMLTAALLFVVVHAILVVRILVQRRADRPEVGTFAGLAAEIEALDAEGASDVTTVDDEWTGVRLAA